jgi:hypothetical protein
VGQAPTRSGDRDHELGDREATAHVRWEAGLPTRNQLERDHFAELELRVTWCERSYRQAPQSRATFPPNLGLHFEGRCDPKIGVTQGIGLDPLGLEGYAKLSLKK